MGGGTGGFLSLILFSTIIDFSNFEREYEFNTQLFGDPDHLNPKGAEIFTKTLDSLLHKMIEQK